MHGKNIRKAIKGTEDRNKITEGVNKVHATAWYNQEGKTFPKEKSMKTDKDTKYVEKSGAEPGRGVKHVVAETDKKNARNMGANDYDVSTGKKATRNQNEGPFEGKAKGHNQGVSPLKHRIVAGNKGKEKKQDRSLQFEAGSEPSGTNTSIYKAMAGRKLRPDRSFGC